MGGAGAGGKAERRRQGGRGGVNRVLLAADHRSEPVTDQDSFDQFKFAANVLTKLTCVQIDDASCAHIQRGCKGHHMFAIS